MSRFRTVLMFTLLVALVGANRAVAYSCFGNAGVGDIEWTETIQSDCTGDGWCYVTHCSDTAGEEDYTYNHCQEDRYRCGPLEQN